jgi:hypothetical protein
MQTTEPSAVAETLARLAGDATAGAATTTAIGYLDMLFGRRGAPGIEMAARATRLTIPSERVQAISLAYITAMTAAA